MIAIVNSLPVKEGAADRIVERFAESRGHVQGFPGFVSIRVLKLETEDEILVVMRWQDRDSFDAWIGSSFRERTAGVDRTCCCADTPR